MPKNNSIFVTMMLVIVWIILVEDYSPTTILTGLVVSTFCTYFFYRALPWKRVTDVDFANLITYPFFLIGQVYMAGFYVIKIIVKGGKIEVLELGTQLKSEYLRALLAHSTTLTPGSIALDMKGDKLEVLWLREVGDMPDISVADAIIKGKLEERLIKAQK